MVGTAGFEPATPCSQSQIGQDRHLGRRGPVQVEAPVLLSVVVRWRPARTAVNGTLVARLARMMVGTAWRRRNQLVRR
jgi:hypothetical protein